MAGELERPPEIRRLASAIRSVADGAHRRAAGVEAFDDREAFYRVSDLALVLARLLEGQTLYRSMGAPGDWGYESAIGDAYSKALQVIDRLALRPPVEDVGPTP